jgi:hypothetical protein
MGADCLSYIHIALLMSVPGQCSDSITKHCFLYTCSVHGFPVNYVCSGQEAISVRNKLQTLCIVRSAGSKYMLCKYLLFLASQLRSQSRYKLQTLCILSCDGIKYMHVISSLYTFYKPHVSTKDPYISVPELQHITICMCFILHTSYIRISSSQMLLVCSR